MNQLPQDLLYLIYDNLILIDLITIVNHNSKVDNYIRSRIFKDFIPRKEDPDYCFISRMINLQIPNIEIYRLFTHLYLKLDRGRLLQTTQILYTNGEIDTIFDLMVKLWPIELVLKGVKAFTRDQLYGIDYQLLEAGNILEPYIDFILQNQGITFWASVLASIKDQKYDKLNNKVANQIMTYAIRNNRVLMLLDKWKQIDKYGFIEE